MKSSPLTRICKIGLSIFTLFILVVASLFAFVPHFREGVMIELLNLVPITQLRVEGDHLYMNNTINSRTPEQVYRILELHPEITTIVEENMDGSIDEDGMLELSYMVRERGLNTVLKSYSQINSGAVDLFLAGVERTMERWAHIWVHSWSDNEYEAKNLPRSHPDHEPNRKYIEEMLGEDDFYWFTIYAAPADDIHQMTEEEIIEYELLTTPIIEVDIPEGQLTGVEAYNQY